VIESYMGNEPCSSCGGSRLRPEALAVKIGGKDIATACRMSIKDATLFFGSLSLSGNAGMIGEPILKEIAHRLRFLEEVGLGYLTLDRSAATLAGGEAQRLRLATQIGSKLMGVLYILDEPSVGLHHRDNAASHTDARGAPRSWQHGDRDRTRPGTILAADYVVDLGPALVWGAGTSSPRGPSRTSERHRGAERAGTWLFVDRT